MSMQEQQLHQVEINMEAANVMIAEAKALSRLHDNKDFKTVILKGYFEAESRRAVLLRSDPEMQDPDKLRQVDNIITSIGGLFAFFNKVYTMGNMAEQSLQEDQLTREEILSEQLGVDDFDDAV